MQYPQQSIKVNANNKGELFSEIRKCVGVLGNYAHSSWINDITLNLGPTTSDNDLTDYANTKSDVPLATQDGSSGTYRSFFVAPYGFEGFAKTAAESGINVSDRALPVICEVKRDAIADNGAAITSIRYDIFAQCDFILYLSADGTMSTRI